LDLTGRIPSPDRADSFLQATDSAKRARLIDDLMASEAFVDNWTLFYANLFQVTSGYYNYISIGGRNKFNGYLRRRSMPPATPHSLPISRTAARRSSCGPTDRCRSCFEPAKRASGAIRLRVFPACNSPARR
jgi:hypothetical protein